MKGFPAFAVGSIVSTVVFGIVLAIRLPSGWSLGKIAAIAFPVSFAITFAILYALSL